MPRTSEPNDPVPGASSNDPQLDQLVLQDPVSRYPQISPPRQHQPEPGLDEDLIPHTDRGEYTYRGTGRLQDRKILITGADSGIGAAIAIAFAREGADIALSYLPVEEEDAQLVRQIIQEAGRTAVLIPGDISDPEFCDTLVKHAKVQSAPGRRGSLNSLHHGEFGSMPSHQALFGRRCRSPMASRKRHSPPSGTTRRSGGPANRRNSHPRMCFSPRPNQVSYWGQRCT